MPMPSRIGNPRRVRNRKAIWAVLPCLFACGGSDPASQLEKAGSWAATTRELAIERPLGAVGRAYTEDLLRKGRQDVQKINQSLDPSALPDTVRAGARTAVGQLDSLMARAGDAVRRGDPEALGAAAATADTLGRTLHAMSTAAKAK